MDDIVGDFLSETAENLDRLDGELTALARDPGSPQLLDGIFRTVHTIKGVSGCLALHRLEELAHAGEELLARLRDRQLAPTPAEMQLLGELAAAIRLLLAQLAATGSDAGPDVARLQPLQLVWSRFPRLVRKLGDQCGKQVRLRMTGSATELDPGVLTAIRDPLTHLVRNAIGHGIEPADHRIAAGKPAYGTVRLRARTTGGQAVVEVADDGAGIDLGAVAGGALARGLITHAQLAGMTAGELCQLVFRPGLSTAPVVSRLSGRGVGMDVVKTNVEGIGGSVEIDSEPGRGTTCRLRLPMVPLTGAVTA
jgi:chemotaxis protein histidine kinase CheA